MTAIETENTEFGTTKRRLSSIAHKNLFDSNLYSIPSTPNSGYQERKAQKLLNVQHQYHGQPSTFDYLKQLKDDLLNMIPSKYRSQLEKEFWPEMNYRVITLCVLWYVSSSISNNLAKCILRRFTHPVALTELQFLISAIICLLFACFANYFRKISLSNTNISRKLNSFPEGILPTYLNGDFRESIVNSFLTPSRLILITTFPLGIFQFVGHITSHKATSLISISLVHSIKALSPIVTVGYYAIFEGKTCNRYTYTTLLLLISGIMLTCRSNHDNSKNNNVSGGMVFLGLSYAFISMIIFVTQNIFAKGVLTVRLSKMGILSSTTGDRMKRKQENKSKSDYSSSLQIDKITILFYCSCIGFFLTLGPFLTGELIHEISMFHDLTLSVFGLILFHGVAHFIQAMLAFQLIGLLSSVNYSVANIMKRIVIICVALCWESRLCFTQYVGLLLTIIGLYGYEKWGLSKKEARQL